MALDYRKLKIALGADLRAFAKGVYPSYELVPHLQKLMLALMKIEAGDWTRLLVIMPPRSGKSFTTSEIFPAWFLGRNPNKMIMMTSYSGTLAATFAARVRQHMDHSAFKVAFGGRHGVKLDRRKPATISLPGFRGGLYAAGVLGGLTGRGADLLIIDDPVKDALEAQSSIYRDRTWNWYVSTAYSRLEPGGRVVLIQTRWHEDDLAGRVLSLLDEPGSEEWKIIHLPAINKAGEALWPERYPVEVLRKIEKTVGRRVWQALYQGSPVPEEGALVERDWFTMVEAPPSGDGIRRVRYWDFAAVESTDADYTAGLLMSKTPDNVFTIEHVIRFQLSPEKRNRMIRRLAERDHGLYGPGVKVFFEQEPGASGIDMAKSIVNLLAGFDVKANRPTGSKEVRFDPFRAQAESGQIRIAVGDWNKEYFSELLSFPYGAHDDQVDCTSGAFNALSLRMDNYLDYLKNRYGNSDPDIMKWTAKFEKIKQSVTKDIQKATVPERDLLDDTLKRDLFTLLDRELDREGKGVSYYDMDIVKPGSYIFVEQNVRPSVLDFLLGTYYGAELVKEEIGGETKYIVSDDCYVVYTRMEAEMLAKELRVHGYATVVKTISAAKELKT